MSGDAVFSGANYQASVIAYVYVYILTGTKLRWLPPDRDGTPTAISGETKGPGDDARIEFGVDVPSVEVQAKRRLRRDKRLTEAFERVRDAEDSDSDVILAVDSNSSNTITVELKEQLERLRAGRTDGIGEPASSLLAALGADGSKVLGRVRIIVRDLESDPIGRDAERGVQLLTDNLCDPDKADAAWKLLVLDGLRLCADRSRRNKKQLVTLLESHGIHCLPPKETRRWHDNLRLSKRHLDSEEPEAALALLREVETEVSSGRPDGEILRKLNEHKASACVKLHRFEEAISSAQAALDHDPKGLRALGNLARAYSLSGDLAQADDVANQALDLHPDAPVAWLVRAHVSAIAGQPVPEVPAAVAEDPEFRKEWVRVCLVCGRVAEAQEVSGSLIAEGDRSPIILLRRVESLMGDVDQLETAPRRRRVQEVERLCSEIVDRPVQPTAVEFCEALTWRSRAREVLGNRVEARQDIERAFRLRPDDPDVLLATVQFRLDARDITGALAALLRPVVEESPLLLSMRADLRAQSGDRDGARRDLERARSLPCPDDAVRTALVESTLALGETELGKRLLSELPEEAKNAVHGRLMQARVAAKENDLSGAEEHYRAAADLLSGRSDELLAELGVQLVVSGHLSKAISVFGEVAALPDGARPAFTHALVSENRLSEAQELIDEAIKRGDTREWTVYYAARIALQRNDPANAAAHLEELIGGDGATHSARVVLAATLLELDLPRRAAVQVDELVQTEGLSAREQVELAQLLLALKRPEEAIDLAFQAYRKAPKDAEINRAFVGVVLNSRTAPQEVDRVGPGTHVRLLDGEEDAVDYIVLPEGDEQPILDQEITLGDTQEAGLIGLRCGDSFVQHAGTWMPKTSTVSSIAPAVTFVYNDILASYHKRFPAADFFVRGFEMSRDLSALGDFQPFVASVHDREQHVKRVLTLYREHLPPLEMVATLARVSVPDFMRDLQRFEDLPPLFVEWSDDKGVSSSLAAAREADTVVLTRTALFSLRQMRLRGTIAKSRRLIAPRALRTQVREELEFAENWVREGQRSIGKGATGLTAHTIPAGDPALVRRRDDLAEDLRWLDANVDLQPRPLEAFREHGSATSEWRSEVGTASHDALELARSTGAALYADDLGLRKLANADGIRSFSSVTLIRELSDRGAIRTEDRDRLLVDLLERRYAVVRVTPEVLTESLRKTRSHSTVGITFAALAVSVPALPEAADILMQVVRQEALKPIRTRSTGEIVRRGLEAFASRFSLFETVRAVEKVAAEQLALLPEAQQAVQAVCKEMRRRLAVQ